MPLDIADYDDTVRSAPNQLTLSPDGLDHIKRFEGFRAQAYDDLDPARVITHGVPVKGTLTIGYGHTGEYATLGMELDEGIAADLLLEDLKPREKALKRLVKVPLTQGEYDALAGFLYNVGSTNFKRSTLLRRLNKGDYDAAASEFLRWTYSKGRKLTGLRVRREAERALFLGLSQMALLDLDALAGDAEQLLLIGARAQPDPIVERGVMKPLFTSKTIMASGLATAGSVLGFMGELDPITQVLIVVSATVFLIGNRWLEHRAGEH